MYLLVKNIDGEEIIVGTSQKLVENEGITLYEINDGEFEPEMINSILEGYDEVE
jgi:hypothetical protein